MTVDCHRQSRRQSVRSNDIITSSRDSLTFSTSRRPTFANRHDPYPSAPRVTQSRQTVAVRLAEWAILDCTDCYFATLSDGARHHDGRNPGSGSRRRVPWLDDQTPQQCDGSSAADPATKDRAWCDQSVPGWLDLLGSTGRDSAIVSGREDVTSSNDNTPICRRGASHKLRSSRPAKSVTVSTGAI